MSTIAERALLTRRVLRRNARELAEQDFETAPPKVRANGIKKQLRNRSAYISRQAARHYETLLIQCVQRSERERDACVYQIRETTSEVHKLRTQLKLLEASFQTDPMDRLLEEVNYLDCVSSQSSSASTPSLLRSLSSCESL